MPFNSYQFKNLQINLISKSLPVLRITLVVMGKQKEQFKLLKTVKKCCEQGSDLEVSLLEFRNTPITGLNVSPAQILFSRRTRTKIPVHTKLLKPIANSSMTHKQILKNQQVYKI